MAQPRKHRSNAARQAAYRERLAQARRDPAQVPPVPRPPAIGTMPGLRRWRVLHHQLRVAAEQLAEEIQEYHDARSAPWQESERAEHYLELVAAYREIAEQLDELPEP